MGQTGRAARGIAVALFLSLVLAAPCAAQGSLEVTPFVGAYIPTENLVVVNPNTCAAGFVEVDFGQSCPPLAPDTAARQASARVFGARVGWWFGPEGAIEVAAGYAPSRMNNTPGTSQSAAVVLGDARFLYRLRQIDRASIYAVLGGSVVSHEGDPSAGLRGTGSGWVFGLGARLPITPFLTLRPEVDDYLYPDPLNPQNQSCSTCQTASGPQFDLVFSLGCSLTLFGRPEATP